MSEEVVNRGRLAAENPDEATAKADDFAALEAIGPKTAALLSGIGIRTFSALAAANPENIRDALLAAGYGFMDPAGWIEQARLAETGDEAGLQELQKALKGGRRAR